MAARSLYTGREGANVSDGIEERRERQQRLEQEKREGREDRVDREETYDWEPERADS